jgi:uncharacterized protein with GYD domain
MGLKMEETMQTYIMLTRLEPSALVSPRSLADLERKVMQRIRKNCPKVKWIASYAVLGARDYVDIFRAPDNDTATKVSTLIRTFGHAQTETWAATEWPRFKEMLGTLGK